MGISEAKKKIVINNYFKEECNVDTTIRQAYEKGFNRGIGKALECSPWVSVSTRLPEEKKNPVTHDFYEYPCTFKNGDVLDVRCFKFGKGHWWHGAVTVDEYVTAWMPLTPYQGA